MRRRGLVRYRRICRLWPVHVARIGLYTYFRTYYKDPDSPTGWNNLVYPNVGMPHVLWQLQGERAATFENVKDVKDPSKTTKVFKGFEQLSPGLMKPQEYDDNIADLVAFMSWMAEPTQLQRKRIGVVVLVVLGHLYLNCLASE